MEELDPEYLLGLIDRHSATRWEVVPSLLESVGQYLTTTKSWTKAQSVHIITSGGEKLLPQLCIT